MSVPLRAALWFTFCQFFQKGIGMLTTPVFTRLLSTAEYGRASAFLSWADLFVPLITLSVWRGMMNLFAKDNDKDMVLTNVLSLSVVVSLVWLVVLCLAKKWLIDLMCISEVLYWALIIYCISQNLFFAWIVRMQYEYRYKILSVASLLYSSLSAIFGALVVLVYSQTAEAKLLPQVLCLAIIAFIIIVDSIKKKDNLFKKEIWLFCLGFAIPLIPHYLSEVILQSSDRVMINSMCGTADVAIYSVAYSVGSLINILASAINSAFVPFQYQNIKEQRYDNLARVTNIVILFVAFCLCCIMLFGREIILVFGGEKYVESVKVIIPICLGVFFNYVFQLFARVQEYFEQKKPIVIASVSCALLNIVLNYIFINIYGYQAAAYTTFICYFAFCFLHYLFYKKACIKNIQCEIYDIKGLLFISIGLIFVSIILDIIGDLYLLKYIILIISVIVFYVFRKKILNFIKEMRSLK